MPSEVESDGLGLIVKERLRQITEERYTNAHDDQHTAGQLADAAVVYASPRKLYVKSDSPFDETVTFMSVWPHDWDYKHTTAMKIDGEGLSHKAVDNHNSFSPKARISELAKAGALLAAEIDRLQRLYHLDEGELPTSSRHHSNGEPTPYAGN